MSGLLLLKNREYCRLSNLAKFIDYRGKTAKKVNTGIPLITAKNVRFGYISREPNECSTENKYKSWKSRSLPQVGDMLFTTEAPLLGNIAIIAIDENFALAQRVIFFQLHNRTIAPFIKIAIMSNQFQNQLTNSSTGIKASKLKEIPLPIPPIAEQSRIVAKAGELIAKCEQTRSFISDATQLQKKNRGCNREPRDSMKFTIRLILSAIKTLSEGEMVKNHTCEQI